jgi:putative transposase
VECGGLAAAFTIEYYTQNAVNHKLVRVASQYSWCSAGWFERKADPAFFKTVMGFPWDKLDIPDDFNVV